MHDATYLPHILGVASTVQMTMSSMPELFFFSPSLHRLCRRLRLRLHPCLPNGPHLYWSRPFIEGTVHLGLPSGFVPPSTSRTRRLPLFLCLPSQSKAT